MQWRSQKSQLGASSSFFLPSPSPFFLPFLFLPSLPLPSFSIPLLFASPFPLEVGPPKIQLGGLGSAVSSPIEPKSNLVHTSFKRRDMVVTILIIFLEINRPNWQISYSLNVCLCFVWRIGGLGPPWLRH